MSDDTTNASKWSSTEASSGAPQTEGERVGFCQDCGKPLTQGTIRTVGTGIFCEPCLTARVGATIPTSDYATAPPYSAVPPPAATTSEPSPAMAAVLGFIPGVGAMYNGQFAKGIVHIVIFAILVSLANNVNDIFGLFVAGWFFYMAFEAYHTAVARRDGLPLPNAFGFNDIGERMGFGKSWTSVGSTTPSGTTAPPTPGAAPFASPVTGSTYVPVNPIPVSTAPDWIGYVPPTTFASAPSVSPFSAAQPIPPWSHAPYVETYTGAPQAAYSTSVPVSTEFPSSEVATRRFPAGALWLIGLGVVILAANLLPDWKLTERWWPPVLFAGLALWTFTRRRQSGAKLVCIIRWPVILMVLAVMSALHAAYFAITFGLTCAVLLIVLGALLLLERTAGASPAYSTPFATADAYPAAAGSPDSSTASEAAHARAAWDTTGSDSPKSDSGGTKGEQ